MTLATHLPDARRIPQILRWVGVLAALVITGYYLKLAATGYLMDLSVFRDAGNALRHNQPLYANGFADGFHFIYPPFAAVLFVPLTTIGTTALQVVWTCATIGALWFSLKTACARLDLTAPTVTATALLSVALLFEPVRSNLAFGQINVLLMAMVLVDVLKVLPERWRGVGIGIAAAIKITPAAFVLILLLRKDVRSTLRSGLAFGVTVVIGLIFAPGESKLFWTSEFFQTDRAGDPDFHRNQALTGLLARAGLHGTPYDLLWLTGGVAVVAAAAWAAYRLLQTDQDVAAMLVVALAHLIAAPFAVTHHWVSIVLLLPLLVAPRYRRWWPWLAATAVIFILAPHTLLEMDGPAEGAVGRVILGNSQLLIAMLLVFAAPIAVAVQRRDDARSGGPATLIPGARPPDPRTDGAGGPAADSRQPVG